MEPTGEVLDRRFEARLVFGTGHFVEGQQGLEDGIGDGQQRIVQVVGEFVEEGRIARGRIREIKLVFLELLEELGEKRIADGAQDRRGGEVEETMRRGRLE